MTARVLFGVFLFGCVATAFPQLAEAQYTVAITRIHGSNLNESEEDGSDEVTIWVDGNQITGAEKGLTDGDFDYVRIGGDRPRERRVNVLLFENKPDNYSALVEIREQQGSVQRDGKMGKFKVTIKGGNIEVEPVTTAKVEGRRVFLSGSDTDYRVTVNVVD